MWGIVHSCQIPCGFSLALAAWNASIQTWSMWWRGVCPEFRQPHQHSSRSHTSHRFRRGPLDLEHTENKIIRIKRASTNMIQTNRVVSPHWIWSQARILMIESTMVSAARTNLALRNLANNLRWARRKSSRSWPLWSGFFLHHAMAGRREQALVPIWSVEDDHRLPHIHTRIMKSSLA